MKRQHLYEKKIGQKLNGMATPDVAGLWDQMEAILDREMPHQEKEKSLCCVVAQSSPADDCYPDLGHQRHLHFQQPDGCNTPCTPYHQQSAE
jgi:hypothetical protein